MNHPKFAVGEVVILQSIEAPEFNGEHAVIMTPIAGEVFTDPVTGVLCRQNSIGHFGYILDDAEMVRQSSTGRWAAISWSESALRKKHQPGTESFSEIMQRLTVDQAIKNPA